MNTLIHSPMTMIIALVGLVWASDANAGRLLQKARKMHNHGHGHSGHDHHNHGHAGHKHSKFSFGLGASGTMSLGGGESGEGGDEGGGDSHAGHNHLRLSEGHDHGGGEGGGGESGAAASFSPTIEANAGYQMMKNFRINANMGFNVSEGLEDPTLGGTFMIPTARRIKTEITATVAAPLSKESSELGRMTTLRGNVGPIYKYKRWTLKVQGQMAYHLYNKALPAEEEEHDHGAHDDHDDHDHDDDATTATTTTDDHDDHDDHDHGLRLLAEDEHAEDPEVAAQLGRETMRVGGLASIGYKISKSWSFLASNTIAMINHAATPQTYSMYMEVAKLSYAWSSMTAFGAFTMSGEDEMLALPSSPAVGFGVEVEFE